MVWSDCLKQKQNSNNNNANTSSENLKLFVLPQENRLERQGMILRAGIKLASSKNCKQFSWMREDHEIRSWRFAVWHALCKHNWRVFRRNSLQWNNQDRKTKKKACYLMFPSLNRGDVANQVRKYQEN